MASKKIGIPSENWAYPSLVFGYWEDPYYAEIWYNGMDWQSNYWLLEQQNFENPRVFPLIIFDNEREEDKVRGYELNNIFKAVMWLRRAVSLDWPDKLGVYNDTVWPFLKILSEEDRLGELIKVSYEHASQPQVSFFFNGDLIKS